MTTSNQSPVSAEPAWRPARPKFRPLALIVAWILSAAALLVAAWIVPGAHVNNFWGALMATAVIAVLNALLPPIVAALRLPLMLVFGLLLVLVLDALMLLAADRVTGGDLSIDSFWSALGVALVASAVGVVLDVIFGTNDDDTYTYRVIQRIARRSGERTRTDAPGIIFLEIDGLALPVLQRAMRDGNAPTMARWLHDGSHEFAEWETDLSSQTGASQAGILLGSNENIPAFRWVVKETATLVACSGTGRLRGDRAHPFDGPRAARERGRQPRQPAVRRSRPRDPDRQPHGRREEGEPRLPRVLRERLQRRPDARPLLLGGDPRVAASSRAKRRDVRPRGHRGGIYPFLRAAMCVFVRDLIVFGVLTDMMKGRPAVYATFSSYDEVAHHSGLERADTLEALRKLDQQFGRIDRARAYAARPYEIVVLSDHGQTQGATFKQRNGYGLDDLVERSLSSGEVAEMAGGDEQSAMVGHALSEATGTKNEEAEERRLGPGRWSCSAPETSGSST